MTSDTEELHAAHLNPFRRVPGLVSAGLVVVFTGTLVLGCWLLNPLAPRYPQDLTEKLEYLRQHIDEYDVLFVGSSAIYRQVIPTQFDAYLAEQGIVVRSFNLGMGGMDGHEIDAMVCEIKRFKPPNLKWVFVGTENYDVEIPKENQFSDRLVWWHSIEGTRSVVNSTIRAKLSTPDKMQIIWLHLLHTGSRYMKVGQGVNIVRALLSTGQDRIPHENIQKMASSRGYSMLTMTRGLRLRHEEYLRGPTRNISQFAERTKRLQQGNKRSFPELDFRKFNVAAVTRTVRRVEGMGADIIYVIPPNVSRMTIWQLLGHSGVIPNLLAFNYPQKYPELYVPQNRWDFTHLNPETAEIYTKYLADEVLRLHAEGKIK